VLYHFYEATHAMLSPYRAMADATKLALNNPVNPFSHLPMAKQMAAAAELFERATRRYGKPGFNLPTALVGGERVAVTEQVVWKRPFCDLIHFKRALPRGRKADPKVLIVAPMSGHYATLLRGTVETFLPNHEVFITDWADARMVPMAEGRFDLDDYVDYVVSMLHFLGPDTHVMAVCQPAVPVFVAVARMEAEDDPYVPTTLTLMGGPIDTRSNPTAVNKLAEERGTEWFRRNVITTVPFPHPGMMRPVYPGFLQINGFMSMNLDRHVDAHRELFRNLVKGDGDGAQKHREFYDEYLAVMDLTAEFYLQTIERVFVEHHLPRGIMMHRDRPVDPKAIRRVALLTVEGEKDDITGGGQTLAAHGLATSIPEDMRHHHLQPAVGHYGVFNGSRFRADIAPRVMDFMRTHAWRKAQAARSRPASAGAKPAGLKVIRGGRTVTAATQAPKKD
jgi:poly(3-hydroxybutyrate) depolymerase